MTSSRRSFLKTVAAVGATGALGASRLGAAAPVAVPVPRTGTADRAVWCALLARVATPVLDALARRKLKIELPLEAMLPVRRAPHLHLEAVGRLFSGLAPWIELPADGTAESGERARFAALARTALDAATDPQSPDFVNFSRGSQPVVDAAFLAQALLRAPRELVWRCLTDPGEMASSRISSERAAVRSSASIACTRFRSRGWASRTDRRIASAPTGSSSPIHAVAGAALCRASTASTTNRRVLKKR